MTSPRPYVPPDAAQTVPASGRNYVRPWMTEQDAHFRCWRCGHREADLAVLADHEDQCTGLQV